MLVHAISNANTSIVSLFNIFPLHIELTELSQIVDNVVRYPNSFFRLFKCVLVSMNLGENRTILKFQLAQ